MKNNTSYTILGALLLIVVGVIIITRTSEAKISNTIDFQVTPSGIVCLNAQLDNQEALLIFDTGANISGFNIENRQVIDSTLIQDPHGLERVIKIAQLDSFILAGFKFKNLPFLQLHKAEHILINDSISGVIGDNVISKFIWDFNIKQKQVTISNDISYCKNIPDSCSIELIRNKADWKLPVWINKNQRILNIDTGCDFPIVLSDSICRKSSYSIKHVYAYNGVASTLFKNAQNTKGTNGNEILFQDIEFGKNRFENVTTVENSESDLFGIPFFLSFERVIFDALNGHMYFLSKKAKDEPLGVINNSLMIKSKLMEKSLKSFGKVMIQQPDSCIIECNYKNDRNDTIEGTYIVYGDYDFYFDKAVDGTYLDQLTYVAYDSVRLPNNKIMIGEFTFKPNKIFEK